MAFAVVGGAIGAASGLYGIYKGIKQEHDASKIQADPYARAQLTLAQNEYNGNMPWATQEAQNIANANANANAYASRAATNGGQLLALSQLNQGQANQALSALGEQEQNYHANMLQNLNEAYRQNAAEDHMVQQEQAAMAGAGAQSIQNGINGIGNSFLGAAALMGGFGNNKISAPIKLPYSNAQLGGLNIVNTLPTTVFTPPYTLNGALPNWLFPNFTNQV